MNIHYNDSGNILISSANVLAKDRRTIPKKGTENLQENIKYPPKLFYFLYTTC